LLCFALGFPWIQGHVQFFVSLPIFHIFTTAGVSLAVHISKKICLGLKGLVVVVVVLLLSIYGDISYLLMYKMNMSTYLIYFYIPFRII
jgi:hypothetical protein